MAVEYDPLTGLPKQQTNTAYGTPMFASTSTTGTGGATGYNQTGGAGGGASGQPDWGSILANDPYLKQLSADLGAQGISDEASARARAQQGIIRFGEAPSNLDPTSAAWIDDTTRQLAQQNTTAGTSVIARLNKSNADAVRALRNALAARGALQSGELGHQLKENQQQFTNAQYDARTQLLDYLYGIQSGLAAANRARQQQYAQGVNDAAGRYGSGGPTAAPPTAPPPPPPAPPGGEAPPPAPPAVYSTQWGTPGYKKPLADPFGSGF